MNNWKTYLGAALIALMGGFLGAAAWQYSGLGHGETRAYLIANPDILEEMARAYEQKKKSEQLSAVGGVTTPFPGAFLGNPNGKIVMAEFSDYGCGYCRSSAPVIEALAAKNPDLKVVIREWPIFDGSETPARYALAAAKQGKFAAFHKAMFEIGTDTVNAPELAAQKAGMDMAAARAFATSPEAEKELSKNMQLAHSLGFSGTPAFVLDGNVIQGAQDEETLQGAIDAARAKAKGK